MRALGRNSIIIISRRKWLCFVFDGTLQTTNSLHSDCNRRECERIMKRYITVICLLVSVRLRLQGIIFLRFVFFFSFCFYTLPSSCRGRSCRSWLVAEKIMCPSSAPVECHGRGKYVRARARVSVRVCWARAGKKRSPILWRFCASQHILFAPWRQLPLHI